MIILAIAMTSAGNYRDTYRSERKIGTNSEPPRDRGGSATTLENDDASERYIVVGDFGGLAQVVVAGGLALVEVAGRSRLAAVTAGARATVVAAREQRKIV